MEEDIKTIENIIDTLKFHIEYENYEENILDECKRDIKALENLLKRYKELEEELESEKFYHNADKEFIQKYHDEASELNTKCINLETQLSNSIPISVIQNKIDEIIENANNTRISLFKYDKSEVLYFAKDVLQELLEERNK